MHPLVSIITPTYNEAAYVLETYYSLAKQTYSNWEWIVIDDGSTDNTKEIVQQIEKSDNRCSFYERNRLPKGGSTCRNIGVEYSLGKFIIFLDADDLMADFCIENRIKYMRQNDHLDFAIFKMQDFLETQENKQTTYFINDDDEIKDPISRFLRLNIPWTITSPIWKKESFLKLKGFDEQYMRLQDQELHIRALFSKQKYTLVDESFPVDTYRRLHVSKKNKRFLNKHTNLHVDYVRFLTLSFYSIKNETNLLKKNQYLLDLKYNIANFIRVFGLNRNSLDVAFVISFLRNEKLLRYFEIILLRIALLIKNIHISSNKLFKLLLYPIEISFFNFSNNTNNNFKNKIN